MQVAVTRTRHIGFTCSRGTGVGQRINGGGYYDAEWICIKLHKVNWWLRYTGASEGGRVAVMHPGGGFAREIERKRGGKRERTQVEHRRGYTWRHRTVVLFCCGIARMQSTGRGEGGRKREKDGPRSVRGVRVSLCFVSPPCFINQRNKQKCRARVSIAGKAMPRRDATCWEGRGGEGGESKLDSDGECII